MPCFNASAYLREAIESVLNQSYKDWELLVIDDGSTDNSCNIVQRYAENDKRICLIEQPNSGACRARNNGIVHARGEYIKFLDADDILEPDCLQEQVEQISTLDTRQIPFGDYKRIDKEGNVLSTYVFDSQETLQRDPVEFFFNEWRVLITCPLHRTSVLREIKGFDETLPRGQESDLHLRLVLADVEFIYIPCKTFRYREYTSDTRISSNYLEGSRKIYHYRLLRAQKCEQYFEDKYTIVPNKYHHYFADVWFSYARDLFARGSKKEGYNYLLKARQYSLYTSFQQTYYWIGRIVGYTVIERVLRWRLKLLHKGHDISSNTSI